MVKYHMDILEVKNILLDIIKNTNPKSISTKVKNNNKIYPIIQNCFGNTISEKIYNFLYPNQNNCENNKQKKFLTINDGYGFCGISSTCVCAKKSVSEKVINYQSSLTTEKKQEIQSKRETTNLKIYGTINTGQTNIAKQKHQEFYSDDSNIIQSIQKAKTTKFEKYNNENYNNPEKIKQTFKEKRENGYWFEVSPKTLWKKHDEYNLDLFSRKVKSQYEEEIAKWLSDNNIDYKRNVKISNKTVDFLIENIAIEFNGLYTHSQYSRYGKELGIDKNYHYNKWKNCKDLGIQLLTIFEDEWISKKQVIKNKILILLNRGIKGLPARKLSVKLIKFNTANEFLEKYHIQGGTTATYYIGAFDQDRLVTILTLKHLQEKIYDLNRFCSDEYLHSGIFSKLLSYAEKNLDIDQIISFSDNRYSDGKLYRNNNFTYESEVLPDYFVTNYKIREHKFNWRKSRIKSRFNCDIENKTELDLTLELGWDRIWDCGKIKWKKLTKK